MGEICHRRHRENTQKNCQTEKAGAPKRKEQSGGNLSGREQENGVLLTMRF